MEIIKLKNAKKIGEYVGNIIISDVKKNSNTILGLATGSSPVSTYEYLIKDHKDNNTDYSNVKAFNLDEYIGLEESDPNSYRSFMKEQLFNHININKENTFIPCPELFESNPSDYDVLIDKYNGIDVQILGVGVNGHIGFNEPPTPFDSKTHIVDLVPSTIQANARFFDDISQVPTKAISMGLETIMKAKKIILIAIGSNKKDAVFNLVKGDKSINWPCTILKEHKNFTLVIDEEAGELI